MKATRILFASCHGYIDSSSGAALSTRDLMELFAAQGMDARVLCAGLLDYAQETRVVDILDTLGVTYRRGLALLSPELTSTAAVPGSEAGVEAVDLELSGVRVTIMPRDREGLCGSTLSPRSS